MVEPSVHCSTSAFVDCSPPASPPAYICPPASSYISPAHICPHARRLTVVSNCLVARRRNRIVSVVDTGAAAIQQGGRADMATVCPATIFDSEQLAALDVDRFHRDGFICLPGIMTEDCRKEWSASLRRCQSIQDHMINHTDWDNMNWVTHGLPSPTRSEGLITKEQKELWAGTSESTWRAFPAGYGRGLQYNLPLAVPEGVENHGFFPEHFPLAYDRFLMAVTTQHPQMLELQLKLHGTAGPLRVDHTIMLNRKAGATGRTWHSHLCKYFRQIFMVHYFAVSAQSYTKAAHVQMDQATPRPTTLLQAPGSSWSGHSVSQMVFVQARKTVRVCRPMLKSPTIVQAVVGWSEWCVLLFDVSYSHQLDSVITRQGPRAAISATNLTRICERRFQIVYPPLPPGSLLCFVHWMPHGVTYVDEGVRWGVLLTYRTMDPARKVVAVPQIPWKWVEARHPRYNHHDGLTQAQYDLLANTPENGSYL